MQSNCKLWFGCGNTMKDGYIDDQNNVYLVCCKTKFLITERTFKLLDITVYPG